MSASNNPWVIDGGYKPFSMQEMLTPFLLYKDAWDKSQEQMDKYNQGADAFSYLDETLPEGSKARSIYDNYSKDLRNAEQSFSQNGLTADNSRVLLGLRRRYTGEIGRLEKASTKLEKLRNLRMAQDAQDPTMIYTVDNPTIDDVLDDKNFNQYSISGNSLYKMGMTSGAAISQRHVSNLELSQLKNPAFLDAVQRVGFTPEVLQAFNVNLDAIPEFKEAINSIMKSTKADTNLTGIKKEQAVQNVIRGLIDGAVYKQNDSLQQNPDYINAKEKEQLSLQGRELDLKEKELDNEIKMKQWMYDYDSNGNVTGFSKAYKDALEGGTGKGGYTINSKGELVKTKTTSTTSKMTPAQKAAYVEADALNSKLVDNTKTNKDLLKNKKGFDVTTKNNGYHYDYVGKITQDGNASNGNSRHYTWKAEIPNDKGEFDADFSGNIKTMRVLTNGEMYNLVHNHSGFTTQFMRIGAKINATGRDDARIVEATLDNGKKEYYVAINKR